VGQTKVCQIRRLPTKRGKKGGEDGEIKDGLSENLIVEESREIGSLGCRCRDEKSSGRAKLDEDI